MQMAENLLWTATRVERRGSHKTAKFFPFNWGDNGLAVPATLRVESDGSTVYRSGGSFDPCLIAPDNVAGFLHSLSHPE